MRLPNWIAVLCCAGLGSVCAQSSESLQGTRCGTVVDMATHDNSHTRYSWASGPANGDAGARTALVLLIGGGGALAIDSAGCPQRLNRNILVRSAPRFQAAGMSTVLVDAPSDWTGVEGLAGFRTAPAHAADLGRIIADVRLRSGAASVWLVGHSRGTLSAANAAARLTGTEAPDGVVLVSPMLQGESSHRKPWVAQTVSDTGLKDYRGALLLLGHRADNCVRSLPGQLDTFAQDSTSARLQVVRLPGGTREEGRMPSLSTCEVGEPHDLAEQDSEFAEGVLRFVRGGRF